MAQIIDAWIVDDPLLRRIQIVEVVLANCAAVLWPHNPEKLREAPEWIAKLRASLKSKTKGGLHANSGNGGSALASAESSSTRSHSATPQKKGLNGLSVASADVIVVQDNSKASQSLHESQAVSFAIPPPPPTPPQDGASLSHLVVPVSTTTFSSSSLDAPHPPPSSQPPPPQQAPPSRGTPQVCSGSRSSTRSSSNRPHYPEVGAENNRISGGGHSHHSRTGPSPAVTPSASQISRRSTDDYYDERGVPPTAATTRQGEVVVVTETGSPLMERSTSADFSAVPLQVKRLSGGITNELFHVYDEDDESASVVVRVFGKETDRVISRESELFYQSLFIPTYVHGSNFLVYDFLDGFYTLPYTEMAAEATPIAHAVAEFQVRATRAALRDHARPLLRDSQNKEYWESFDDELVAASKGSFGNASVTKEKSRFHHESNYLIDSLSKWVDLVLSKEILQKVLEEKQADFLETAHNLRRECAWMLSVLEQERGALPEGVCHNDLLSANVMIHSTRKEVRIIDFDYTKRSFLLYDVANHFNEYPGLDCDYDTYFPSDAQMSDFIAEYRKGMRAALEKAWRDGGSIDNASLSATDQEIIPNAKALFWTDSSAAEAEAVAQWTRLAKLLTLASHLSWSVWSLLQEAVSTLDVDFLDYAKVRFRRYMDVREECAQGFGGAA